MATISMQTEKTSSSLREKAKEEFKIDWVITIYLALMFSAFFTYRRLTLHESGITYLHYGAGVIEALILAKVILIGRALGLGRRFEEKPVIISVLFKSVIFGAFVAVFSVIEHVIDGFAHHETWDVITQHLFSGGRDEILAKMLVVIVTFIPFFGFWEIDRVLGHGKLFELFFHERST